MGGIIRGGIIRGQTGRSPYFVIRENRETSRLSPGSPQVPPRFPQSAAHVWNCRSNRPTVNSHAMTPSAVSAQVSSLGSLRQ